MLANRSGICIANSETGQRTDTSGPLPVSALQPARLFRSGRAPHDDPSVVEAEWRNRKCDVLALWCHLNYGGDIFVTTDTNFMKRERVVQLGVKVMSPCEAAAS